MVEKKNYGEKAYSVDKTSFAMMVTMGAILAYGGYAMMTLAYVIFLYIIHATDLNNEYVTQNVFIRPVYQFFRSTKIFENYFLDLSPEKYFKSILVFFYTIIFVLLLRDLMNLQLYYNVYSTIQMNAENNPKKDPTLITKVLKESPYTDTITFITRMITSLAMIFLYPFLVLYIIRCYDVKNNIATQMALISITFVPLLYYLITYMANMKRSYGGSSLLQHGKKYLEEKDFEWIDRMDQNYQFQFNTVLWIPLFIGLLSLFYFIMHYGLKTEAIEVKVCLSILFVIIPILIILINYNILFQCYDDNNVCGIFRNGLIKYEVYHNGIKSFYDAMVKYNYLCFPR